LVKTEPVSKPLLPQGKPLLRLGAVLVAVLIFAYLLKSLWASYEKLSQLDFTFRYQPLLLSAVILCFSFLFNPWAWKKIMGGMGEPLAYGQSFGILYLSQLGKYLPGRIWSYISQVYLARQAGLSGGKTLLASVLFQVISSLLSLYVFAFSFLFWQDLPLASRMALFALATLMAYLILRGDATAKTVDFLLNRVFKRNMTMELNTENIVGITGILLLSWVVYGTAYYYFLNAFYPVDIKAAVIFTGVYAISWLIGYASLLTPGGLGVREGVQAYLLSFFLPLPIAIIISLACRIWITAGEIVVSLIALYLMKKRKRMAE